MCWMKWCVEWSDVLGEVIMCWVKWYCVVWSDVWSDIVFSAVIVLCEVMCWEEWCVDRSDIVLGEVILCWVKWCAGWSDNVLVEEILCWNKWCVERSDVLGEVMCWQKWCVGWSDIVLWSDVLREVILCCVKWYSCFISRYSSSYFHEVFVSFTSSFLIITPFYLLNYTSRWLLLHLVTLRHTTVCRTTLAKWSVQHRNLYLTKHNTHNRQSSMPRGFRTRTPNNPAAPNPRLRPRGQRDRRFELLLVWNVCNTNWLIGSCV
jgi:hypothetical protein